MDTNLINDLKKVFKGDIDVTDETLTTYSHDASLFEIRPEVVVFPRDSEDVQNLVKWVNDNKQAYPKLSITARAAGTCMAGGPINDSIIMDTTRYMNKIISVNPVTPYILRPKFEGSKDVTVIGEGRVQPGCFYRDFETATLAQGLLLPCYTASKTLNAVGGMIGNNSAGELTLRYGKTEDYARELKVVLADGHEYTFGKITRRELYNKITETTFEGKAYKQLFELIKDHESLIRASKPHVSKNSAGYMLWHVLERGTTEDEDTFDLAQLIIGSQGTLGLVTEIVFRLVAKQKKSKLLVTFLPDFENLGELAAELLTTNPESIESYDDKTFKLALKFFTDFLKSKGLWGTITFTLSFIPEFWMLLTGGIPKMILMTEYAGETEAEIDAKCKVGYDKIKHFGYKMRVTSSENEAEKYWDMRRDSFNLLRKHVQGLRTAPFIDDIIVRPEFLKEFLPKVNALIAEYPSLIYTIAGHAENGNFHIIPLVDPNDPKLPDIVIDLSKKVYDLVLSYHGSIDAEHNDGIIRSPFLKQMYGPEVYELFVQTKNMFDPKLIFNPKKKVGVTFDDIRTYLAQPHHDAPHAS
jgi:FAD/FMN-containing dehydrogenase